MNLLCGRLLPVLLMGITGTSIAAPVPPGQETRPMPVLPQDTHCRLSVSNPVVDYGILSRWQLEDIGAGNMSPGTRSLTLSVFCPHPRSMILRVEDRGLGGFRYGERGIIRFHLRDAQLDGNKVELRTITPGGVIPESGGHMLALNAGQQLAPVIQGTLTEGRTLTARLDIQPVLAEGDTRVGNRQHSEMILTLTLDD